jgi:HK97 family phage prohead protease
VTPKKPSKPKRKTPTRPDAPPARVPFPDTLIYKGTSAPRALTFTAKATPTATPRVYRFTASTGEPDRVGDRILVSSWKLDAYKRNPVILAQHRSTELPIGRARNIWTTADALMVDVEFLPDNMNPDADRVRQLVDAGYMNAVSVAFRPGPSTKNEFGGRDFLFPVDLTEISVVTVGANPSAVLHGRSSRAAIEKWVKAAPREPVAFRLRDEPVVLTLRDERYTVTDDMARAFVRSLHATLTSASFQRQLKDVVDVRVARAIGKLRGRLD